MSSVGENWIPGAEAVQTDRDQPGGRQGDAAPPIEHGGHRPGLPDRACQAHSLAMASGGCEFAP